MDLQESRARLDELDRQLVQLFEARMEICKDVADYKIATGKRFTTGNGKNRSWTQWALWPTGAITRRLSGNCSARSWRLAAVSSMD